MVDRFEDYMAKYFQGESEVFKGYLFGALESKDESLCFLDESLGDHVISEEIRNCELLTGAGLFREEIKLTRDGRNLYKIFLLTPTGKEMAEQIKQEGYKGKIPQSVPMIY
jgi:hypothetical protein